MLCFQGTDSTSHVPQILRMCLGKVPPILQVLQRLRTNGHRERNSLTDHGRDSVHELRASDFFEEWHAAVFYTQICELECQ